MFQEPANSPWCEDGIEGDEQCWRLDVAPDIQFQLFAKTDNPDVLHPHYRNARLFYEKDVRQAGNPDNRIHYACGGFPIADEEATAFLTLNAQELAKILVPLINEIHALPNQPEWCGTIQEQRAKMSVA